MMQRERLISRTYGYDNLSSKRKILKEALTMKQSVRFVLILVVCLALSISGVLVGVPATRAAGTGTWTQLPLYGGPVSVLAIDPTNPSTLYTQGAFGGFLSRSVNGGDTWTNLDSVPGWAIYSLAIDPILSLIHISEPT